jgi:6-phosphogluconolactonase
MSHATAGETKVVVADDLAGVARLGADLFISVYQNSVANHGRFDVALSGGSTPRALHALLAASPDRERIDWTKLQFYWGDERCVPPDDAESNYRMARETLLALVPVSEGQIHRMRGELQPEAAAEQYERELRATMALGAGDLPRFHLLFLGMGPDGHTLSLFPQTGALDVHDRAVTANYVPKLDAHRVTLTYPAANNAAVVAFLVAGADKADALAAVLEGPRDPRTYPSQGIAPTHGYLYWLVDRAAAANLRNTNTAAP